MLNGLRPRLMLGQSWGFVREMTILTDFPDVTNSPRPIFREDGDGVRPCLRGWFAERFDTVFDPWKWGQGSDGRSWLN
jgi:hypothetical protein